MRFNPIRAMVQKKAKVVIAVSETIRILLMLVSLFTVWYAMRKIRKSQMQIQDTVFWIGFFGLVLALAVFPGLGIWLAYLLGFYSPINFVFLFIIFVLLIKIFIQSIQISQLDKKIKSLSQRMALDNAVSSSKDYTTTEKSEESK